MLRILSTRSLMLMFLVAAFGATGHAGLVQSAVFSGEAHVANLGEPSWDPSRWETVYPNYSDVGYIANAGSVMADLLSNTSWNCMNPQPWAPWSCQDHGTSQAIGLVSLAGGATPIIDVMASATNGATTVKGTIAYFYRLDKLADDAPNDPVPINLSGSSSLSYNGRGDGSAYIRYQGPGDASLQTFWAHSIGYNLPGPQLWEGDYSVQKSLRPGGMAQVYMGIQGEASFVYPMPGSGSFQGVMDPLIEIDSAFTVFYNGSYVPATQLYSLSFSPGFEASAVPEPATRILLLASLGFVLIGGSRRARAPRGAVSQMKLGNRLFAWSRYNSRLHLGDLPPH
jgi:hypothetical protein